MLRALYDYAVTHPEVRQRSGCEIRTVKFIVDIVSPGIVTGLREVDKHGRKVNCPSAGKITVNIDAHPLIEKAEISLRIDPDKALSDRQAASLDAKRNIFFNRFADATPELPVFKPVAAVLGDQDMLEQIVGLFQEKGGASGDPVGFSVDGIDLWDDPDVLDWWERQVSQSENGNDLMLDVVTGDRCAPARLWKAMRGTCAAGGQSAGVALVSFNERAFDTYGFLKEQNANSPVSQKTADMVMDAVIALGNASKRTIGDARLIHWYAGSVPEEDDLIDMLFGPDASQAEQDDGTQAEANADRLVQSPFSGEVPPDLSGIKYHIMVMQPFAARMAVRSYETGTYGQLYDNIRSWFGGLSMQTAMGLEPRFLPRFYGLLYALLTDAEASRNKNKYAPLAPYTPAILNACLGCKPVPDAIGYRALAAFRSGMYTKDGADIQWGVQHKRVMWLKLWNNRKEMDDTMDESKIIPAMIDRSMADGPYVCGRLMAVYDELQRRASPGMNATVVSRFFTSCAQNPALVLGRLQSMAVHHMENIRSGRLRELFGDELSNAWGLLGPNIPKAMSMQEQARFACGYWQEHGYLKAACNDMFKAESSLCGAANGNGTADENGSDDDNNEEDK